MGYESKIYIVEKFDKESFLSENGKRYADVIAMFDLCKYYPLSNILREKPATDCYFYGDDGNDPILHDAYGKELTEASVDEVIRILNKEVNNGEKYRRALLLLALLKETKKQIKTNTWTDIAVLHYGY